MEFKKNEQMKGLTEWIVVANGKSLMEWTEWMNEGKEEKRTHLENSYNLKRFIII